jgi:hypothetical protein
VAGDATVTKRYVAEAPTTPLYRYDKFGPAEAIDTENGDVAAFTGDERNLVVGAVNRNEQSPPDTDNETNVTNGSNLPGGSNVTDGGPSTNGS